MDNARFYKRSYTLEAIEARGCALECFSPYSTDLKPIKHKWAEVKSLRRKERYSIDELFYHNVDYANLF
ncbi:hypothetical protein BTN49_0485 [Candidatus Enterovibrio escicola]|uniref:Mobile element protein n=1 Tax=Candidatus Enterovibrio escicola TaxID=1927127 RepID=A0A2A5T5T4_9GAMM|nr:hypothetical protein BTN49_0485 [Candidatus Enterovibrio escacola]